MTESKESPYCCVICRSYGCSHGLPICKHCLHRFNRVLTARCGECRKGLFDCDCRKSDDFKCLFFYIDYITTHGLIYYIKNIFDERLMDFIVEMIFLSNNINPKYYDAVTFVPRKPLRKRIFGVDQAEQFAKSIERQFGIPVIYTLERIGGRDQKTLSARERFFNIKGRYRLRKDVPEEKYNRILLVDDLCTTGSTVKACAKLLREKLSRQVGIMLIARND